MDEELEQRRVVHPIGDAPRDLLTDEQARRCGLSCRAIDLGDIHPEVARHRRDRPARFRERCGLHGHDNVERLENQHTSFHISKYEICK